MLGSVASISVSALVAASKRIENTARNVVNANTVGSPVVPPSPTEELLGSAAYKPTRVEQFSLAGGGVGTRTRPTGRPSQPLFDPTSPLANSEGRVDSPNVDLAGQFTEARLALDSYRANIKAIETADRMLGSVLEISS